MRSSSLISTNLGISREIQSDIDYVKTVSNNMEAILSIEAYLIEILAVADTASAASLSADNAAASALLAATFEPNLYIAKEEVVEADILGVVGNIMSPLLDLPLKNSLAMKAGVGSVTFERTTTATYIDRYGVLQTASIDEPRFEKEGLLIEGGSTNLQTYSNGFTDSSWTKANITLTADFAISPDGTANAFRCKGTGSSVLYKTESSLNGVVATQSIWVKSAGNGKDTFRLIGGGTSITGDLTATDEWVRYEGSFTGDGSDNCGIQRDSSASDFDVLIAFAQLEELPFASSYIPTTTTAVTRATDYANVTREGNMPNVEANGEVSISLDYTALGNTGGSQWIWGLYKSSQDSIGLFLTDNSIRSQVASSTDNNVISIIRPTDINTTVRVTQTIDNSGNAICLDGVYKGFDADIDNRITETQNSDWDNIRLGGYNENSSTMGFNGHIKNFRIYDKALTETEAKLA